MLALDDVALIFVATTLANLVVEFGAEIVAEWIVNGQGPLDPDPTALDHLAGFQHGCISAADTAFSTLVNHAGLTDGCVSMLRLVVN